MTKKRTLALFPPPSMHGIRAPIPAQNPKAQNRKSPKLPKRKNAPRQSRVAEEIAHLQSSTNTIIPKTKFRKLVRELIQVYMVDLRVEDGAFDALQEAAEEHLVNLLKQTNKVTIRSGRVTIKKEDLKLVMDLLSNAD